MPQQAHVNSRIDYQNPNVHPEIQATRRQILEFVDKNGSVHVKDLRTAFSHISPAVLQRNLKHLVIYGWLFRRNNVLSVATEEHLVQSGIVSLPSAGLDEDTGHSASHPSEPETRPAPPPSPKRSRKTAPKDPLAALSPFQRQVFDALDTPYWLPELTARFADSGPVVKIALEDLRAAGLVQRVENWRGRIYARADDHVDVDAMVADFPLPRELDAVRALLPERPTRQMIEHRLGMLSQRITVVAKALVDSAEALNVGRPFPRFELALPSDMAKLYGKPQRQADIDIKRSIKDYLTVPRLETAIAAKIKRGHRSVSKNLAELVKAGEVASFQEDGRVFYCDPADALEGLQLSNDDSDGRLEPQYAFNLDPTSDPRVSQMMSILAHPMGFSVLVKRMACSHTEVEALAAFLRERDEIVEICEAEGRRLLMRPDATIILKKGSQRFVEKFLRNMPRHLPVFREDIMTDQIEPSSIAPLVDLLVRSGYLRVFDQIDDGRFFATTRAAEQVLPVQVHRNVFRFDAKRFVQALPPMAPVILTAIGAVGSVDLEETLAIIGDISENDNLADELWDTASLLIKNGYIEVISAPDADDDPEIVRLAPELDGLPVALKKVLPKGFRKFNYHEEFKFAQRLPPEPES